MGLTVLNPDVNESYEEFAVVPGKKQIRFGMAAVKGVGVGAVEEIVKMRDRDGKFATVEDFAKRVSTSKCNKRVWESLIKSGGFDALGDRSDLLFNLENVLAFASKLQKEALSGQTDLFGSLADSSTEVMPSIELKPAPVKHTDKERLMWERELIGLYISAHPLDHYDTFFAEQTVPLRTVSPQIDGQTVTIGGLVTRLRTIVTKSGSKMAFVGVEDKSGESEIIIFPNLYEKLAGQLEQDVVITASGKVSARDRDGNLGDEAKLIANEITVVTDTDLAEYQATGRTMSAPTGPAATPRRRSSSQKNTQRSAQASARAAASVSVGPPPKPLDTLPTVYVRVKNPDDMAALTKFKQLCTENPGQHDIIMMLGDDKTSAIRLPFRVDAQQRLQNELAQILGKDCVVVK